MDYVDASTFQVRGELTVRGCHEAGHRRFRFHRHGHAGFEGSATISRDDFGATFNAVMKPVASWSAKRSASSSM